MPEEEQKTMPTVHSLARFRKQDPEEKHIKKTVKPLLVGLVIAGLFSVAFYTFAYVTGPFIPGAITDPNCLPTDPTCTVYPAVTYSSGPNGDVDLGSHSIATTGTATFGLLNISLLNVGTGTFGELTVGTYTLPASSGLSGQVLTAGVTTGTVSWTTPTANGIFVGLTAITTYTGDFSGVPGYQEGDTICNDVTNYPGSHMCTVGEILHTISTNLALISAVPADTQAWVNSGSGAPNDCEGHTSTVFNANGLYWQFENTGGTSYPTSCDSNTSAFPLACCR